MASGTNADAGSFGISGILCEIKSIKYVQVNNIINTFHVNSSGFQPLLFISPGLVFREGFQRQSRITEPSRTVDDTVAMSTVPSLPS